MKWFSRDLIKARKLDTVLSNFFRTFGSFALRSHFSRWKHHSHLKVSQMSAAAAHETGRLVREQRRLVKTVRQRAETQVIEHQAHMRAAKVFLGWREEARTRRLLRAKS